jgi:hypothetical protein
MIWRPALVLATLLLSMAALSDPPAAPTATPKEKDLSKVDLSPVYPEEKAKDENVLELPASNGPVVCRFAKSPIKARGSNHGARATFLVTKSSDYDECASRGGKIDQATDADK